MRRILDRFRALFGEADSLSQERVVNLSDFAAKKRKASSAFVMIEEDQMRMRRLVSQMRSISGATSEAEVIADAIGLLEWYVSIVSDGDKLYTLEDGEPTELKIIFQSAT